MNWRATPSISSGMPNMVLSLFRPWRATPITQVAHPSTPDLACHALSLKCHALVGASSMLLYSSALACHAFDLKWHTHCRWWSWRATPILACHAPYGPLRMLFGIYGRRATPILKLSVFSLEFITGVPRLALAYHAHIASSPWRATLIVPSLA
ncbi:hypothetical protein AHAS_Ahas11G0190200 [Arachis hypogaea]